MWWCLWCWCSVDGMVVVLNVTVNVVVVVSGTVLVLEIQLIEAVRINQARMINYCPLGLN